MGLNRMDRLHSLMVNQNPTDKPVAETPGEEGPTQEAAVDWGTEGDLVPLYMSGAPGSSDGEHPVRHSTQKIDVTKKPKRSLALADIEDQDEQKQSLGDISPPGVGFVPLLALAKYPYKFLSASPSIVDSVSKGFFAAEKFWSRKWTVFFIYPPGNISPKPIHFVLSSEVNSFFKEINAHLKIEIGFPSRAEQRGFYLTFPGDGQPRPLFLGISSSKEAFNIMDRQTPSANDPLVKGSETLASPNDDRSFAAFAAKMEAALLATKAQGKASKEHRKLQRVQQKDVWCRQLRRSQRYLGIRPKSDKDIWSMPEPPRMDAPGRTWEEYVCLKEDFEELHQQKLPVLNHKLPVPYPFESEVVFICFDVEAYERSQNLITEIGISSLDTLNLSGIPPGPNGANWIGRIKSRHFRIKEYKHLVNEKHIVGCPDRFEKAFGVSEFISIKEAPQVIASCFRAPFAGRTSESAIIQEAPEDVRDVRRKLVLVGHNAKSDIDYLRGMGYDLGNLSNVVEVLDTADLYRALQHEENSASLGTLLYNLALPGWNLHNAGNDAAYTLQAFIGIVFKGLASKAERQGITFPEKVGKAAKEAAERVVEDSEEWSVADGTDDGGVPVYNLPSAKDTTFSRGRGGNRGRGDRGRGGFGGGALPHRTNVYVQGSSAGGETCVISTGQPNNRSGQNSGFGSSSYGGGHSFGGSSARQQGIVDEDEDEFGAADHGGGVHFGRGNSGGGSQRQQENIRQGQGGKSSAQEGPATQSGWAVDAAGW